MKPGELTAQDVAVFSRLIVNKSEYESLDEADKLICGMALSAAKTHAGAYTGLDIESTALEDITFAILVMAAEMVDNRQMTAQYTGQNPTVMQILDLHSSNLLPRVEEPDV